VYFAIRGTWLKNFSDSNIFATLKKTISTQREFWGDNSFDYYTVIMSPTVSRADSGFRGHSMTGSSVKNGFLIQSSNNPFNNWNNLRNIFNHEMMHDWIGRKIKMKHEELNYWFSEGFTDYYAYKNRLRNGDITFTEWKDLFNKEVFKAHYKNPEKNKPNYILKDEFWKSRNIEKLPYRRGAMFAFWLDNQIFLKSNSAKSLDDVMRELYGICAKENKLFTDELFLELVQKYIGRDISYFFQKHMISAVDMEWKNEELIPEFKIEMVEGIPVLKLQTSKQEKYLLK
jgi:predicted metalloprotease with PDZ domain